MELNQVSKKYKNFLALDEVSFRINEGEIFGYIGPNGAGKTTTIKIIVGLIRDFSGQCRIGSYHIPNDVKSLHKILGYLPQDVAFQDWRTVDHALTTFAKFSGLADDKTESRITELLSILDLSEVKHKKITQLSGGMTQKVGLAQALLHNPKFLVLDEPLSGLDPANRLLLKSLIKDLSHKGITVFFSSHILSDVQDVATKIGIINNGKIIKVGTLDELISHFNTSKKIEISLSHEHEEWRELNIISGVSTVEKCDNGVLLLTLEPAVNQDEIVQTILKQFIEKGCQVRSIKPFTPDLDNLYLKYIQKDTMQ
jgi:ABC-2 type transport system ATP-binding protein